MCGVGRCGVDNVVIDPSLLVGNIGLEIGLLYQGNSCINTSIYFFVKIYVAPYLDLLRENSLRVSWPAGVELLLGLGVVVEGVLFFSISSNFAYSTACIFKCFFIVLVLPAFMLTFEPQCLHFD